jgi:drug/metabolite transporter (DMT)-like permease
MASLITTSEGTSDAAFGVPEWTLVILVSVIWGASFLLIAESLEGFAPATVGMLRIALGWATLSCFAAARAPIAPEDHPRATLLGVTWMAVPLTLFPVAEQWISSSVAGMLNGAMPILTAVVASVLLHRLPGRNQLLGMAIGFAGIVCIALPTWSGGSRLALGVALVLVALCGYAISTNVSVPLTQRYGTLATQRAVQARGLLVIAPFGLWGLRHAHLAWRPVLAITVLGVLGTGVAFALAGELLARVGATRGAIFTYLMPVVSIVLGVTVRGETVAALAVAGTALVVVGAVACARAGR